MAANSYGVTYATPSDAAAAWLRAMVGAKAANYNSHTPIAPEVEYVDLRERYVSGEITLEAFGVKVEALLHAGL